MTQEQIDKIVEEYRQCKSKYHSRALPFHGNQYYRGRMEAIKFTLEVAGVYVEEVALLL